jgi:hypothetical protein
MKNYEKHCGTENTKKVLKTSLNQGFEHLGKTTKI